MQAIAQRWLYRTLCFTGALGAACGTSGETPKTDPCSQREVFGCGQACSDQAICAPGLFCSAGACTAQCTVGSVLDNCGEDASCSADGRCLSSSPDGGEPVQGDGADAAAGEDVPSEQDAGLCGLVDVKPEPVVPNVLFIVDQSHSMDDPFDVGTTTRWQALKDVLLAEDGLIPRLEARVDFGVVLYTGDPVTMICPQLTTVAVASRNVENIRRTYDAALPQKDTPTGDAIEGVLAAPALTELLEGGRPTIFILATDGEPDRCEDPDATDPGPREVARQESIDALAHAYSLGIRSYVIAVADEAEISQTHVQDLANAGQGGSLATSFRVANVRGLENDLMSIVAAQVSCRVPLQGTVTATDPCVGTVELDGKPLPCGGDSGFRLEDPTTLALDGDACTQLKAGGTLTARFPCDAVLLP